MGPLEREWGFLIFPNQSDRGNATRGGGRGKKIKLTGLRLKSTAKEFLGAKQGGRGRGSGKSRCGNRPKVKGERLGANEQKKRTKGKSRFINSQSPRLSERTRTERGRPEKEKSMLLTQMQKGEEDGESDRHEGKRKVKARAPTKKNKKNSKQGVFPGGCGLNVTSTFKV